MNLLIVLAIGWQIASAQTWTLHKEVKIGADKNGIKLGDPKYEYEANGYKCAVSEPIQTPLGKNSFWIRTLSCNKAGYEVSTTVSCGGTHGYNNSGSFNFKGPNDHGVGPLLTCSR